MGRPRKGRIDDAVLRATVERLGRAGYLQLTIAFVATAIRPLGAVDEGWPDDVVDLIMRGITP